MGEQCQDAVVERQDARLAYSVQGHGPPVLLIQGVGVAGCGWQPQVEALYRDYTLCRFDHRGVGASTGVPSTIEAMAEDSGAIMNALGWPAARIVGHSRSLPHSASAASRCCARSTMVTPSSVFLRACCGDSCGLGSGPPKPAAVPSFAWCRRRLWTQRTTKPSNASNAPSAAGWMRYPQSRCRKFGS